MLEDGPHSTGSSSPMGPLGNRQEGSGTQFPKMPTRWKRTNFQQSQISRNSQSPITQGVLQGRTQRVSFCPGPEPSRATKVLGR